ncbi:B-cell receptor CD22-like [Fundulus heteroclitus]|uniref:B-cell receptor CD22-like n=1 Tax=Fundulus heteroclitus TaxID=8078 RepID=UPI00165B98F7|nr:B-cell receptor CD22-like [Fundulus heteroclitus]
MIDKRMTKRSLNLNADVTGVPILGERIPCMITVKFWDFIHSFKEMREAAMSFSAAVHGVIVFIVAVTLTQQLNSPGTRRTKSFQIYPNRSIISTQSALTTEEATFANSKNQYGHLESSPLFLDVLYAPRFLSVSLSPSGKIAEGSSVTLTCSSDANPAADYNWYKEGKDSPEASGKNFTISNIQHEHSGDYYCKVQNKIGRHNATVSVIVVGGPSKLAAIGTTLFIFLIIFIFVFLLVRNRRSSIPPSPKPVESPRNIEQCQPSLPESQEDVQYASIQFLRKQKDPVYANFKPAKPRTSDEEEEEEQDVEYTTVKFASTSCGHRTEGPESGEDLTALYSVVNKFQRPKLNS